MLNMNRKFIFLLSSMIVLILLPFVAEAVDESYVISSMTRIMIFAMAAVSLDLIVGYGAMVSFGHAAFVGLGAYVAAILSFHINDGSAVFNFPFSFDGSNNLFLILIVAIFVAAIVAALTGLISLRTHGIHFIMITLAFAQMLYYLFISLDTYGGEDGLLMPGRNQVPFIDTADDFTFYYLCLLILVVYIFLSRRLVNSQFGRVIRGCKLNEKRMQSLGFNTYWYRLTAYIIAATGAAVAGVLLANKTEFVDPGLFSWHLSGELLVMVILGGLGSIYGAVIGAFVYLLLEQVLSAYTEHWMFFLGPFLILVVIYARHGIYGVLQNKVLSND
ncbi:MAG: branched-chain amino acid ABC transporter permease [Gammaproteobacteria bacterium]|nr:branched-chain amino acid ABC transporter permease [Gammaproteobacteria bacterium]